MNLNEKVIIFNTFKISKNNEKNLMIKVLLLSVM